MAAITDLNPDAVVRIADHLSVASVVNLGQSCRAMRDAVRLNQTLWCSLYSRQFVEPWRAITCGGAPKPGSWRQLYLDTHDACHQLASTRPAVRSWSVDSSAVALALLRGAGSRRLVLTAQQNILEVKCAPPSGISFQLYGHNGRVSCAELLDLDGDRLGVLSGSADQTLRQALWLARRPAPPIDEGDEDEPELEPPSSRLTLLTPVRTLRGHQESITCLQLLMGATGVCVAATGGKDRCVKLWGLAPLLPSPVHQPLIATLRGHGAPVAALLPLPAHQAGGGSGEGGGGGGGGRAEPPAAPPAAAALLSASQDGRVKLWDVWSPACVATAKLPGPASLLAPITDPLGLGPGGGGLAQHAVLCAGVSAVQLLDTRTMRASVVAQHPGRAESVLCMAQWGSDVVTGGRDAARVWDLRMAGGQEPRLLLRDRGRQVTCVHMDRLKVVTATDEYGEAPIRVWCLESGRSLAQLGSAPAQPQPPPHHPRQQPTAQAPGVPAATGAGAGADGSTGGGGGGSEEDEEEARWGWEGVTALACRGALLITGNWEGLVCERDFSRGGLTGQAAGAQGRGQGGGGPTQLLGKFWRAVDLH